MAAASGTILDVDCRVNGGAPCEQWTVSAYDENNQLLQSVVLDAPQGPVNPQCQSPQAGPGDSKAMGWIVSVEGNLIQSIILRYTGEATNVGLAFDNFSVASLPGPPEIAVTLSADAICLGESLELSAQVSGGLPPYEFLWEGLASTGTWRPMSLNSSRVNPVPARRASAIRCMAALVEPPSATQVLAALRIDPSLIMSLGFRSSHTICTMRLPAAAPS